jgi:hypothetical protein
VANTDSNDISAYSIASNGALTSVPGSPLRARVKPFSGYHQTDAFKVTLRNGKYGTHTLRQLFAMAVRFDVFLCHSSADKPVVEQIAKV